MQLSWTKFVYQYKYIKIHSLWPNNMSCDLHGWLILDKLTYFVLLLLAIVLSVLLRYTDSDYPFGILDIRILITPLVSSNSS